jgi:4-hydroxybenzoate polyprenyltransferase
MRIKPYLQLVRLPNVFTAAADSLAGWLLVRGSLAEPARWVPLALASMAVYAAGIALNDWFDYDVDLRERPGRPLPSGQVSRRFAAALGALLLIAGHGLAALSGSPRSLAVVALLSSCVLGYDAGLKHTWLGPQVMGACRGLNVLLGMSQAPALGGPAAWLVALSMAVFVTGITWISRSETSTMTGPSAGLSAGIALENLALVGLLAAALQPRRFPLPRSDLAIVAPEGLLVLLVVGLVVNLAGAGALREPVPAKVQHAIKTAVFALVWLNVGMVTAVRGATAALAVAVLWIPAFLLGRWLYAT